jgi:hypothetical protein
MFERNLNSRVQVTGQVIIKRESANLLVEVARKGVTHAHVAEWLYEDLLCQARFDTCDTDAEANIVYSKTGAVRKFYVGSGDTGGCNSEECCEKLSGEQHGF